MVRIPSLAPVFSIDYDVERGGLRPALSLCARSDRWRPDKDDCFRLRSKNLPLAAQSEGIDSNARQHRGMLLGPVSHHSALSASLSAALTACATQTYQPKTVEGAQCKMQCYTSIGGELGGIPYAQKMNNCLSACADIERLKAEGR